MAEKRVDIFWPQPGRVTRIVVEAEADGRVALQADAATADEDEEWLPVPADDLARGVTTLLRRETRLEMVAARYGLASEDLLATLEHSVVGVATEADLLPPSELDALRSAGISLQGAAGDPSGVAQVASGRARFQRFREECLTVGETASRLGVSAGRVRQLVAARSVITIPNGDGSHLLPTWQLVGGQLLPGLSALAEAAAEVHPLTLAGFMTRPDVDLVIDGEPVAPVDWLVAGGDPVVVADLVAGLSLLT